MKTQRLISRWYFVKYYDSSKWKYDNNGNYDKSTILYWLRKFCEWEEIKYDPDLLYSNQFVEFVLYVAKDFSTNVKGAGKFLNKNQKIYDNGDYTIHSADCLFKTFIYILREMDRKERSQKYRRNK